MEKFKQELLKLIATHDCHYEIHWNEQLEFYVMCNDMFGPGSDTEPIESAEDVALLKQSLEQICEIDDLLVFYGMLLYVARKRKQDITNSIRDDVDQRIQDLFASAADQ